MRISIFYVNIPSFNLSPSHRRNHSLVESSEEFVTTGRKKTNKSVTTFNGVKKTYINQYVF